MRTSNLISGGIGIAIGLSIALLLRPDPAGDQRSDPRTAKAELPDHPRMKPTETRSGESAEPAPGLEIDEAMLTRELDPTEIEAMLERRGRSREALISAALLTGDKSYLEEAAGKFPDDPQVQLLVITNDVFPTARSEWINRLKRSQPDNSLASMLKAGDLFASGSEQEAVAELRLAAGQTGYDGFTNESMLAMESGLIEIGHSPLEAKVRSTMGLPLHELVMLRDTLSKLHPLAENATTTEERNELATLGFVLGNQLSQGAGRTTIINGLVGMATESRFLNLMEPDYQSPTLRSTPSEMLAEIDAEREEIREITTIADRLPELGAAKFSHYLDRMRTQGELEAIRWAREQLP